MTEQPGLFDLPEPPAPPPVRAASGKGKRGERWTRTVVAELRVVDSRALRDAALERLSETVTIDLGPADNDPDLLDPEKEIQASAASAVQWWLEPLDGIWPLLDGALRVDEVAIDATDEGPGRVRVRWSVSVKITDIQLLRTHGPCDGDTSFAEVWNRAADPCAPLTGLPGVTWAPTTVEVARRGARHPHPAHPQTIR